MLVSTEAIVLSSIKYGDTSLIVRVFTLTDGLKSYLLKGILTSKKGKLKAAYFQPLTQLEIVAMHKNKGTLESIREARLAYPCATLYTDITKNAMTLFLAEMLTNSIHEEEPNAEMFRFIQASIQWLDTHAEISNFHLSFLLTLTKYLGFYPDVSNIKADSFDLLEGEFIDKPSLNPLVVGKNLENFKKMLGIKFDAIHTVKIEKKIRQDLLKSIILYFELHLQGFRKPRSLAILNEVFS
jgi:DNA repair protein RecO (recombination protein O)